MVDCIDDQCNVVGYIVRSFLSLVLIINAMLLLLVVYMINQTLLLFIILMINLMLLLVRC
jgi:hypothetical protein